MSAKFIVFEGGDGVGTTTVAKWVKDKYVEEVGNNIVFESEPSDSSIGRLIRWHLSGDGDVLHEKAMEHLFRGDRIIHSQKMRGMVNLGKHVICDRYYLSTVIYQSVRETNQKSIRAMQYLYDEMMLSEGDLLIQPDVVFFLDADVDVLSERRQKRKESLSMQIGDELYENDMIQMRVIELYREWMDNCSYNENKVRIDSSQTAEEVIGDVMEVLRPMIFGSSHT